MDKEQLSKYFPLELESQEQQAAFMDLRAAGRELAEVVNRLVPESPAKGDILGRLFRIVVDAELAIRMDGVSKTQSMILTRH